MYLIMVPWSVIKLPLVSTVCPTVNEVSNSSYLTISRLAKCRWTTCVQLLDNGDLITLWAIALVGMSWLSLHAHIMDIPDAMRERSDTASPALRSPAPNAQHGHGFKKRYTGHSGSSGLHRNFLVLQ